MFIFLKKQSFVKEVKNNLYEYIREGIILTITNTEDIKMITINLIKEYAKLKGIKVTENFSQTGKRFHFDKDLVNEYNAKEYGYSIGIELKKNVFYWWKSYDMLPANDEHLFFSERYNWINGVSQTTFNKGYKAQKQMEDFINKKINK